MGRRDEPAGDGGERVRGSYPTFVEVASRFTDVDSFGHVNNIAVASYYEEARARFNASVFGEEVFAGRSSSRLLIARTTVVFLAEAHWPRTFAVGVGVARVGRSSFDLAFGLFDGESCIGTSSVTLILVEGSASTALSPGQREALLARTFPRPGG